MLNLQIGVYYLFRTWAQVYLYFTRPVNSNQARITLESKTETTKRYRVEFEGHLRHFVFIESLPGPELFENDPNGIRSIIKFSDSILACIFTDSVGDTIDITDTIKEYAHYIWSNPFITFQDLNITEGMQLKIIFDDLTEKDVKINAEDSLHCVKKDLSFSV
jgi:hypothetical protein